MDSLHPRSVDFQLPFFNEHSSIRLTIAEKRSGFLEKTVRQEKLQGVLLDKCLYSPDLGRDHLTAGFLVGQTGKA